MIQQDQKHYMEQWTDEQLETLVSDWNGKDKWFLSQGERYHEQDVQVAEDILSDRGHCMHSTLAHCANCYDSAEGL